MLVCGCSPSALCLMARLKCLAMDWGRTIIGTFHHASADSFELIDNLCLLVRGRMVYFGEASSAAEVRTQPVSWWRVHTLHM